MGDSASKTELSKRKLENDAQQSEKSNGYAKKLKTSSDDREAHDQQKCKFSEVKSDNATDADGSVTGEVDKNGTGVSGGGAEAKDEASFSIRLAVVLEGFPQVKMTEEQAEKVETALAEIITPTDEGEPIQFSATEYEGGALVFTCANRTTRLWLYRTARKLVPWPGARLTVGQADTTLKGTRLVLLLTLGMNKRSNERVLDLLQKQNRGISTTEWKIISRVEEGDENVRLTLWLDDKSSADLKARNFKLFLGLARSTFVPLRLWNKLKSSSTTRRDAQLAPRNPQRRPANYAPRQPSAPFPQKPVPLLSLRTQVPVSPQKPISPWIVPPWDVSHNLLDSLVLSQYRGSELWEPNPYLYVGSELWEPNPSLHTSRFEDQGWSQSRELEFADTDLRHIPKALFTSSDPLSPRERTYGDSAVLQNFESRYHASERSRDRGLDVSERTHLGKSSYAVADRAQRNESRYASDRARDRRQAHETENGAPDVPELHEARFTASDRALSRDSAYLTPNRDQLESLRHGVSKFDNADMPLTESIVLQNLKSTLLTSERARERGFGTSELAKLKEASYSVSDRARLREPAYSSDRSQEDRYFTDRHRPVETGYRTPDSPQLRGTTYTTSDRPLRRETEFVTVNTDSLSVAANRDKSRDLRYASKNRDDSENVRFRGSGQSPTRVSRYSDLNEPRADNAVLRHLPSKLPTSEQPLDRRLGLAEASQSRETSYTVSDRARRTGSRYTSDRQENDRYSTSESRHRRETVYKAPDPPELRGASYIDSDRQRSHNSRSATPNRDKFRTSTSATGNGRKSRDSRYVSSNRDKSENSRFRGSGRSPSPVSGLSDLDECLAETAVLQSRTSTLLTSDRHRERGFDTSDVPQSRGTGYIVSDRAQRRDSRYVSDLHRDDEYSVSERQRPRDTGFEALTRNSESATASRDKSRDSRYLLSNQDRSENRRSGVSGRLLSGDSRFKNLVELPARESGFRGSGEVLSREGRFEERDPLYSYESRFRLSDPQLLREFDNTVSLSDRQLLREFDNTVSLSDPQLLREFDNTISRVPRSREDRLSSDTSPRQSRSSYTTSKHSHYLRAVDSRKTR